MRSQSFARAALCRARGRIGEAVAVHQGLLTSAKSRRRSLIELARDFKVAGLIDGAFKYLTEALHAYPDDLTALEELEDLQVRLSHWTAAIETRERMPRTRASLLVLARLWAAHGRDLLERGDVGSARDAFETSIATSPRVADGYVGLGDALERSGRPETAACLWTRALGLRPDVGPILYLRLSRVLESHRFEALLRSRSRGGDPLARVWLARTYLDRLQTYVGWNGLAIWTELARVPGGPPRAGELAELCETRGGAALREEIRARLQAEIDAVLVRCTQCKATSREPRWLCPYCFCWEGTAPPD